MTSLADPSQKIELWNPKDIVPYEANAKIHDDAQVEKLATSIRRFGWTQPIVIDSKGVVIIGHGRRLAAIKLGLDRVPVVVRRDLTIAEADAMRLADNRVTSTAYDNELLQTELQRLSKELEGSFELTDLGFDQKELDFVLSDLGEIDDSAFVQDITAAVEQQKSENESNIQSVDESAAPVVDALGFKRVTIAQSRELRDYMAEIEERTQKTGAEALLLFLNEALA